VRREPPKTLATDPEIKPGDLICGVCGAGNSPDRKFCRRCGNSLAAATVAVADHVPWYRRIFHRATSQRMAAGERPSSMGRKGRSAGWFVKRAVVLLVLVLVIAPVIGYFAVPAFKTQVDALLGSGGASVVLLQHPSTNALDADVNTFWLADPSSGNATLTVTFAKTINLAGITFYGGASGSDYANYGRPKQVDVSFPGNPQPVHLLLNDDPATQVRCVGPVQLATFTIRVVSSYPGRPPNPDFVALRWVEFKEGSCSQPPA
jgi:hypothetical protein